MTQWLDICHIDEIVPNTGRCALFQGEQVAIFRVEQELFAVNNYCPFSKANVISRGLVGDIASTKVIASPIYKQHFALATGKCLEDESTVLKTYSVRLNGDVVQLAA